MATVARYVHISYEDGSHGSPSFLNLICERVHACVSFLAPCVRFCPCPTALLPRLPAVIRSNSRSLTYTYIHNTSPLQGAKIPGGATLVFDVELLAIKGSEGGKEF